MRKSQTIVVTGASGALGKAISYDLASQGYDLILLSRDKNKLNDFSNQLKSQFSISVHTVSFDFLNAQPIDSLCQYLQDSQRPLTGLVLITPRPNVKESLFPLQEDWQKLFQSAFTGPLELIKNMISYMTEGSKIVILSGIASLQVMPNHPSAYGVIRSMWLAQAKALAYALGPKKIHVNTVSPGGVLTEHMQSIIEEKAKLNQRSFEQQYETSISNVPLRKYAQPQEVASVVQFLLSEQSSHLTGINIPCDGGFVQSY